ncbi:hypothetical protein AB0G73_30245 [Streptomyces sp. NPDC020719]|uniref:hypothetical protein n=1 Tax=unclassified Streptomyces TaxID=2593676 RepID=UPI0033FC3632
MGIFTRLTGTRFPESGVVPRSATEVRAALLALGGPDVPYRVREAFAQERADLAAEWRIGELGLRLKVRMRLDRERHEVRALEERWDAKEHTYGRGQMSGVHKEWTYERGADGRRHLVETLNVRTSDMRDALRDTVLEAGWGWRGVLRKL